MPAYTLEALRGPLAIVRREAGARARRFDRLRSPAGVGATVALCDGDELWAILDDDDDALRPGAVLELGEPDVVPLEPERLLALGLALASEERERTAARRTRETGLKVVDVLAPLIEGGQCWLLGGAHLARLKLLEELELRCARFEIPQTLVFPVSPLAAAEVVAGAPIRAPRDVDGGVRTLWPISEHLEQRELAELDVLGTTRIMCGPRMPGRGHWPAVDLLASRARALSEALVEPAHVALAMSMLELLSWAEAARADPLFDALIDAREFPEAIARSIELSIERFVTLDAEGRARLQAAQDLERYFAQPLLVDGPADGSFVDREQALVACREILARARSA